MRNDIKCLTEFYIGNDMLLFRYRYYGQSPVVETFKKISSSSSHILFPSQKTSDNNKAPEQPIDMRMKKDNKAKA